MSEPERTDDGHYVVIDGRRWRATDPAIPEERRAGLTRILMAWRREVRHTKGTAGESAARAGVQAAKVALGERPIALVRGRVHQLAVQLVVNGINAIDTTAITFQPV
jgi:hypothetical protein